MCRNCHLLFFVNYVWLIEQQLLARLKCKVPQCFIVPHKAWTGFLNTTMRQSPDCFQHLFESLLWRIKAKVGPTWY